MIVRTFTLTLCTLLLWGCAPEFPVEPVSNLSSDSYTIGTWNVEYLHDRQARGFPEFFAGGPHYGPRTDADYRVLADVIKNDLDAVILVLNEINAQSLVSSSSGFPESIELERLSGYLGAQYAYVVSQSGGQQRVAILWDTNRAHLDTAFEITYPEMRVQGEDLFPRDPLVARFTLLAAGAAQNDLMIVGLHLASGRANDRNHDSALALLVDTLTVILRSEGGSLGGETDIILAGDLNLDFFDLDREEYLEGMELGNWDVLADRAYPFTRLGGVPLEPDSRLDYVICTRAMRGPRALIEQSVAIVHQDLADGDYDRFRRIQSDHFPVTVNVRLAADDD